MASARQASMADDRLNGVFAAQDDAALESQYDAWAATYDADHDAWGWLGPERVAEAALRLAPATASSTIHDAGCGTGKAGVALRQAGFGGEIVGLDLSGGMLDAAAATGAYDSLIKCSLLDLPIESDSTDAIVSSGVFTHGHVGGEAFAELCRVARADGVVVMTQRVDLVDAFAPHSTALEAARRWLPIERSSAANLHPGRDHVDQVIVAWRVLPKPAAQTATD